MRSFVYLLALSLAGPTLAQDEDLGEASGLEPESKVEERKAEGSSALRLRGYGLVDWRHRKGRLGEKTSAPNAEINLNGQLNLGPQVLLFGDARAFYLQEDKETSAILDQGGIRMNLADHWSAALGKERNRRAPGLLLSPSDFLHSSQSAPGLPEDRSGIWLGRLSWQTETQSLDLLILPVDRMRDSGLPEDDAEFLGGALRWFGRFQGFDLSLDLGRLDNSFRSGASVQTLFARVWKSYLEAGYDDEKERGSALFGLSYEGSSDYSLRAEVYHNAAGAEAALIPAVRGNDAANAITTAPAAATQALFIRRDYFIANLSFLEIAHRWSLRETWIKSLEDSGNVHLLGADYIAGDSTVLGVTYIRIGGNDRSQYAFRPFDWQLLINAKYSF